MVYAGSFVGRGGRSQTLRFKADRRHKSGLQWFDIHDDGRFKVQVTGPFDPDLRYANLREPVEFSLVLGTDVGEASIQLDRTLHFRPHDLDDHREGDDDDAKSDRSEKSYKREKSYKSEKSEKGRFLDADGDLVHDADAYRNKARGRWLRRGR